VEWIQQGFNLLKAHANFEMDYLLPKLSEDWAGFQPKYATYQDVASYSCHLRKRLTSYYDFNAVIPEDLSSFWTEYSELQFFQQLLQCWECLVGRWKPEASDTYIRSYNGLVAQLQAKCGKALQKAEQV
jgi:hypothetical protein